MKRLLLFCFNASLIFCSQRPTLHLSVFEPQENIVLLLNVVDLQQENSDIIDYDQERSIRTKEWNRLQRKILKADTKEELEKVADALYEFKCKHFDLTPMNALYDDSGEHTPSRDYWNPIVAQYNEQAKQLGAKELLLWDQQISDDKGSEFMNVSFGDLVRGCENDEDFCTEHVSLFQIFSPVYSASVGSLPSRPQSSDIRIYLAIEQEMRKEESKKGFLGDWEI